MAVLAYRLRNSHPWFAVALFSFVAFLFPVLNLVPISTLMNDRYMYVSCIPLFGLWAYGLSWVAGISTRWGKSSAAEGVERSTRTFAVAGFQTVAVALAVLPTLGYAQLTHEHLPVWRNSRALWENVREHVPQLAVVQIQWSDTLHEAGDNAGALTALETALARCQPDELDRRRILEKMERCATDGPSFTHPALSVRRPAGVIRGTIDTRVLSGVVVTIVGAGPQSS